MAIDLDACIGCNACTIACQAENNIPVVGTEQVARGREMHWIRVDRYYDERGRAATRIFQPVPCMHCEHAPCEVVCPVGATVHDSEGLNVQVYNRCVGTRFCSNNCPYKVRRFNFLQYADRDDRDAEGAAQPGRHGAPARRDGEVHLLRAAHRTRARIDAEQRGPADRATATSSTACQAACPTRAIIFGDLQRSAPATSSTRKASPRHYALLAELEHPAAHHLSRAASTRTRGRRTLPAMTAVRRPPARPR